MTKKIMTLSNNYNTRTVAYITEQNIRVYAFVLVNTIQYSTHVIAHTGTVHTTQCIYCVCTVFSLNSNTYSTPHTTC